MKMSARGRQRLTDREGKILKWYKDSEGVWTCCVGHTAAAGQPSYKSGQTFTAQECDDILARDLTKFEDILNAAIKVPVADHEYDALLSVMFNCGPSFANSTAIKRLNAGDRAGCADAIMMWNKPAAIIGRRQTERSQFLTPYSGAAPAVAPVAPAPVPVPAAPAWPEVVSPPDAPPVPPRSIWGAAAAFLGALFKPKS